MDEVDGMAGNADRGGMGELVSKQAIRRVSVELHLLAALDQQQVVECVT
jgi:hypothetical protein